jgi:tetratricopeptide (TPR) repeat protein
MSEIDWKAKFPELRPIESVPLLWSVKGCGLLLYGRRDEDEETCSYVRTYGLCLLGIPILNIGAYRYAEFAHGPDVLGRVPLSQSEWAINSLMLMLVLLVSMGLPFGFGLWALNRSLHNLLPDMDRFALIGRPDEFARQKLAQADQQAAAGKPAEAARLCREVAQGGGPPDKAAAAVRQIGTLLEHPAARASASEQAGVLQVAVALRHADRWPEPPEILYQQGRALMERRGATDPAGALEILEAVAPLAPGGEDLDTARRGLLERLVAARPDDPELVSRLAAVHEAQGEDERAVALLEPLRARLSATEGARILGLADVRRGRVEPALTLLRPYAHAHLESLRAAAEAVKFARQAATKRHHDQVLACLPQLDPRLSNEENGMRILKYMDDLDNRDPEIEEARRRRRDESSVVPVALELGTILRNHAQSQPDRKSRESELDEAEKLLLEVVRLTGEGKLSLEITLPAGSQDPDQHRLNLAEVYYWEGKPRDGRALIDQVLAARNRHPGLLLRVSQLLRRVGSLDEARALAEEAYRTETNPLFRGGAAVHRSLVGLDLDDRILWVRRGHPADPQVKILLCSDLAVQAVERGDDDQAVSQYREALALYDAMPEEPATLNNSAMILFSLSMLAGDRAAFDRGFARIKKAHELDPIDGVSMRNLTSFVREGALGDIIGPAIDLRLLKEGAELDHLDFLYHDRSGRADSVRRVRSHAGVNRLIALLERTLMLSPRDGELYKALMKLYSYRGETEKQRGLLQRLERIDLDQSDEIARAKSLYAGDRKEQRRAAAIGAIRRAESARKAAKARRRDLTFAVAAAGLANGRMSGHHAGVETDADAVVSPAEEAHAAAPSYQTRGVLVDALLFRAGRRLARAQPAYARMAEKTRQSTTDADLIGVALNGEDPLRDAARQDPDVRRAVDLIRAAYRDDPDYEAVPWAWSLLRALDPQEGARMARTYLDNESAQLSRAIQKHLEPVSASAAMSLYWAAEMVGQDAGGADILKAYSARGVPLPIE